MMTRTLLRGRGNTKQNDQDDEEEVHTNGMLPKNNFTQAQAERGKHSQFQLVQVLRVTNDTSIFSTSCCYLKKMTLDAPG